MLWWIIPVVATLVAWVYTRVAGSWSGRSRRRPEPGSPEDQRDLARFAEALRRPGPGGQL